MATAMRSLSFTANVASTTGLSEVASRSVRAAPAPVQTEAVVSIRFHRFGRKKLPFFRLVAIDSRKRRDGRPLEELGWYDPIKKETNLDAPAIKKWLMNGAQPSDTVENLLKKALILPLKRD